MLCDRHTSHFNNDGHKIQFNTASTEKPRTLAGKKKVCFSFFFFKAVFCIIVQKGFTLHVVKFWDQKGLHEQPSETLPHNRIFNFFKIFIS